MGKSSKPAQQTSKTEPWEEQKPYLERGFQEAEDIYQQRLDAGAYQGERYTGLNADHAVGLDALRNTGALTTALQGGAAGSAGSNLAASQVLGQNAQSIYDRAFGDPTQGNIQAAGQYADNPYLSGAIDAASRDVTRNLSENVLPGIGRNAVAAGNTNSTRTGIAEGVALRGAQDRIGDISSTMRGNAYQQGLGLAEGARGANLNASLGANSQLGQAGQLGLSAGAGALDYGKTGAQAALAGGDIARNAEQGQLDDAYRKWVEANGGNQQLALNDLWSIVGGANWGGTTQSTGQQGGSSGLQDALGTAASVASIAMMFCWVARSAFGAYNPEWLTFREWMLTKAPKWLFKLYSRHGYRFSLWLDRHPRLKPAMRWLMRKVI